jgi:maleate isomerase
VAGTVARTASERVGIGVVAPYDFALDHELWGWTPHGVTLHVTRTPFVAPPGSGEPLERARGYADLEAIRATCRTIAAPRPSATAYMCTSCTFVHGLAGDAAVRQVIADSGVGRAITTSSALLEALAAVGARKVALATPYAPAVTARLADFLGEAGLAVTASVGTTVPGGAARASAAAVVDLVRSLPRAGADAIFLSCTNLPTQDVIPGLEAETGLPVLSANLVTMWAALRAVDRVPGARPERLFAGAAPVQESHVQELSGRERGFPDSPAGPRTGPHQRRCQRSRHERPSGS